MGSLLLDTDWRKGPPDYQGELKLPEDWEIEYNCTGNVVLFWHNGVDFAGAEKRYSIDTNHHNGAPEGKYVVDTWEPKNPAIPSYDGGWNVLAVCESAVEAYAVLMLHIHMN